MLCLRFSLLTSHGPLLDYPQTHSCLFLHQSTHQRLHPVRPWSNRSNEKSTGSLFFIIQTIPMVSCTVGVFAWYSRRYPCLNSTYSKPLPAGLPIRNPTGLQRWVQCWRPPNKLTSSRSPVFRAALRRPTVIVYEESLGPFYEPMKMTWNLEGWIRVESPLVTW